MRPLTRRCAWATALIVALLWRRTPAPSEHAVAQPRRNVLIFVADGLRPGSVNPDDMPTLSRLREEGVDFRNSHSIFPTFTMPNASAIATGHGLGDASIFGNTLWVRYPMFESRNFGAAPSGPAPFLENDQVLADLNDHHKTSFVGEETLFALAQHGGYQTAAIGKIGPTAIQALSSISPRDGRMAAPVPIVIDDATGTSAGIPLRPDILARMLSEGLSGDAPSRNNGNSPASQSNNGYAGDRLHPGTLSPNLVQQQWFADVTTRVVLPAFEQDGGKPFVILFWSRDPDGTQHNQGDSLGALSPGINGPTSRLAVRNADRSLRQLIDWLDGHPAIKANTDIIVTSDHGFATVSRREVDRNGRATTSDAAKHSYVDRAGEIDTEKGTLPQGFLAIDLALDLRLNLFDPDRRAPEGAPSPYKQLRLTSDVWEHPIAGNGLVGQAIRRPDGSDATVIVVSNGGTDLLYLPGADPQTVRRVVELLLSYDYMGGVFVDDKHGTIPGALPLSAIGLSGSGLLPRPDIVAPFKVFYLNRDDLQTGVQVTDAAQQTGQGQHGGFGRESTYNTMVAWGPGFRRRYVDLAPAGNADIADTLAHLMGLQLKPKGELRGRVLREALAGASESPSGEVARLVSAPANGRRTVLFYQEFNGARYLTTACLLSEREPASNPADCR